MGIGRIKDGRTIFLQEDIEMLCKGLSVEACGRATRFALLTAIRQLVSLDRTMCVKIVDGSVCFTFTLLLLLLAYSRLQCDGRLTLCYSRMCVPY